MRIRLSKYAYLLFYFGLSTILLGTLLGSGYLLTLDMVFFSPSPKPDLYSLWTPPLFGGSLWILSLIKLSSMVAPTWYIQKFVLLLILFLSGVSAHSLIETKSRLPKYYSGILYMVNPFLYLRFLAGHWLILLAYAITPFAVKYFIKFLDDPSKENSLKTLVVMFLISISSHVLVLNLLAFLIIFCFKATQIRSEMTRILPRLALLALALLALNSYWLGPIATANTTIMHEITGRDLFVFAPRGQGLTIPYSLATMYGFWRGGYTYTKDIFPAWHLFFIIILLLAVHGFTSNYKDRRAQCFLAIGLISFLLAMGSLGPLNPLFRNIPMLRGFRDSQKFVPLLVLSYSYLGALGLQSLLDHFKQDRRKVVSIALIALSTPLVYNFTQFGFWGQIQPTDYPADWYRANEILNADPEDFNVLFLPWHLYMDFRFVPNQDKRIANPARVFFDNPVIYGKNLEVPGIYTQSTNPGQRYIESMLSDGKISGESLRLLNVKYVVLAKEVDWTRYRSVIKKGDLEPIFNSENLTIYRNPEPVSIFYGADELSVEAFEPIRYRRISPVRYEVEPAQKRYTVFVPPNLDSTDWVLDGVEAPEGFYAVWESMAGTVKYSRFLVYKISYAVSLLSAGIILMVWFEPWRRFRMRTRKLGKARESSGKLGKLSQ